MKRILIVDDSAVMRKNLKSILGRAGYEIAAEATNGEEAVRAYAEHKPDLVTMDVTMPVMNGIEAVKRIVASDAQAKIVVISAFDQRSMLFEAMENGASHYMIKPITSEKLLTVVDKLLGPEAEVRAGAEPRMERPSGTDSRYGGSPAGDAPQPGADPFAIENRDGKFVVSLNPHRLEEAAASVRTAMQGLLFVKPLAVAFYFRGAASVSETVLVRFAETIDSVLHAGGTAEFIADDEEVVRQLRRSRTDIPASVAAR